MRDKSTCSPQNPKDQTHDPYRYRQRRLCVRHGRFRNRIRRGAGRGNGGQGCSSGEGLPRVAEARRKAADAAEAGSPGDAAQAEKKTGPESHLEAVAREAGYAPESCIGVLANPCMETEEGASTHGMMDCYGRESEVWDARLNASYREQLAPQKGPEVNAATVAMEARQLRKVQTAWIPWRDATCEVLYADGIPIYGSLANVDAVHCIMVLTARQALWMDGLSTLGFE